MYYVGSMTIIDTMYFCPDCVEAWCQICHPVDPNDISFLYPFCEHKPDPYAEQKAEEIAQLQATSLAPVSIYGWRLFHVERGCAVHRSHALLSCVTEAHPQVSKLRGAYGITWDTSEMEANCPRAHTHQGETSPAYACRCGVYVHYDPADAVGDWCRTPFVLARCVFWGKTIEATTGVRAQYVKIIKAYLVKYDSPQDRLVSVAELQKAYPDVEFEVVLAPNLLTILSR